MNHAVHNKIVSFIWSIADDCLRDVYVRGKYRDVILPMVVLRRLDTLLEPTTESQKFIKDENGAIGLPGTSTSTAKRSTTRPTPSASPT